MKNYKVFLKLLPFQGGRVASLITQGDCPGLGASALSGRVGAYLQKLNQFRFCKSAAKINFFIETAKKF